MYRLTYKHIEIQLKDINACGNIQNHSSSLIPLPYSPPCPADIYIYTHTLGRTDVTVVATCGTTYLPRGQGRI